MSTASARAYASIRALVLDGRFAPGERLKEEALTSLCGVSRTPVREALRRLTLEGLVVLTPHQGAQVVMIGDADLEEIYTLRAMLEAHAAARAAVRLTEADIARLKRLTDDIEAAIRRMGEALQTGFAPANSQFHQIILRAAASPRLTAMTAMVVEAPLILRTLSRYSETELLRALHHHRELIAAFEARDAEWARSVMASHIHAALRAVTRPAG